jgi:hypothetical protein
MKHLYSITIHGNHKTWSCLVWLKPEHAEDWLADGIECCEVVNTTPEFIQYAGLGRLWRRLQRIGLIPLSDS